MNLALKNILRKSLAGIMLVSVTVVTGFSQTVLSLDRAMEIASSNSPEIKSALLSMEQYEQLLVAQKAALKSNFSLSVTPINYSLTREFNSYFSEWNTQEVLRSLGSLRVSQPIALTDGTVSLTNQLSWQNAYSQAQDIRNKSFTNNLFLSYSQPLFTYNRTKLELKELELDLENAQLSYAIQLLSLEKNVTQSFYNVYQAQMSLQISKEEFENQQASYNIIKNKVEGGLSAMEELYQAEVNLATSRSNYKNQEVSLENTKDNFKKLIGMSLYDDISILANVSPSPVEVDLDKALKNGLDNRMELRQRQIDIENSEFQITRTSALNEFKGNMDLSIGLFGDSPQFINMYDTPTNSPGVSLSFTIPLFDWGEKKARLKAADAALQRSRLSLEDEKNNIIIAIRNAYRSLQNLENQILIQEQNQKNAQLTYDINLERYKNGDLTSMDLNMYQTQLSERKLDYSAALINYRMELLNLKIQTLFDFEQNKSYVSENLKKEE